jgi:hypothetical protein
LPQRYKARRIANVAFALFTELGFPSKNTR